MTYRNVSIVLVISLLLSLSAFGQSLDERTAYWRAFNEKVLADKVRFVNASPHRAAIWRIHLRTEMARRALTPEQQDLVLRALPIIVSRDLDAADAIQAEIA